MANGYIGKISAIVTANTSDLSRKLQQSRDEVDKFANKLSSSINRASAEAAGSLQKIFTPLQRLERQLKSSSDFGVNLKLPVDQIRAFVSAAEQINKPLAQSAAGFSKLSMEVQAALLPALNAAQDAALRVNLQIENTGRAAKSSFDEATASAIRFEQAAARASQAQSIAAGGLTGSELQFRSPAAFAALTRTADVTRKAGGLPAAALADGSIREKVERLTLLSDRIQEQFSKIDNLQITGAPAAQIDAANDKLQRLADVARQGQDELQDIVDKFDELAQKRMQDAELQKKVDQLGFRSGNAKGFIGPKMSDEMKNARASSGLNIISEFDAEVSRNKLRLQELRQEAAKVAQEFDSINNQGFFDTVAIKRQQGELSALRDVISRVSATVRGPLESAFREYAIVVTNAMASGESGLESNEQDVKRLRAELIKLIAATGQVGNVGQITGQVNRAGDIGRGGFDKFSLAINQAAFAVDDFFSATGGLEFKLRAVQNNITQLGFIVGGTTGLIAGLATAIGGQLVIAVLKSIGVLDEEKDVMEALNSAFSEQKQRVEALTAAYNDLGSSIRDAGLGEAGRTQASRRRELEEIKRLEEEVRVSRASAVDPEAERLRIEIARLKRKSEESDDAGVRTANEIKISDLERQLARRSREAAGRQSTARTVGDTVVQAEIDRINTQFDSLINGLSGDNTEAAALALERERRRQLDEFQAGEAALRDRFRENPNNPAAQQRALSEQRRAIEEQIDRVQENLDDTQNALFLNPLSPLLRAAEDEYGRQLASLSAEYAALQSRIREAEPGAAFTRFVEAQFAIADTLDRVRANLDQAGGGRGFLGDAAAAVNRSLQTRRSQADQAREEGDTARLDALTKEISALEEYALELESASAATKIFSDVISRLADDLDQTVAQEARSRADSARRAANADPNDPFLVMQRWKAELEAGRAERREIVNEERNVQLRQQFEDDAIAGRLGPELQSLISEREQLQRDIESGSLSVEEERAARRRRREVDAELEQRFERSPGAMAAMGEADRADTEAARFAQLQESERRGRDLMMSEGEQSARAVVQSLEDITNAMFLRIEAGEDVAQVTSEAKEARASVLSEARRSIAPALFALQDQVANAVLQGPSRAALNAADVTTAQGTAELNRLLRGDDPAKDQNLLELQKQTSELEKLNANLGAAGVAD